MQIVLCRPSAARTGLPCSMQNVVLQHGDGCGMSHVLCVSRAAPVHLLSASLMPFNSKVQHMG